MREHIATLNLGEWVSLDAEERLQLVKVGQQSTSSSPVVVTHSVIVEEDCMWKLHVHNHLVDPQYLPGSLPAKLDISTLQQLLSTLEQMKVCAGHPDIHFLAMMEAKKGAVKSAK